MKRYHINKTKDRRLYKKTAKRSRSINAGVAPRGGFRL